MNSFFALSPDSVRCPYPIVASLREQHSVAWFPQVEAYVVTSYDLIVEVLRSPGLFSNRESTTGPVGSRQLRKVMKELLAEDADIRAAVERRAKIGNSLVLALADPPVHERQRKLVNRAFTPSAVRGIEPLVRELAEALVDDFVGRGTVELIGEFAAPLPMTVIARALGVELDRMDDFRRWSDGIVTGFGRLEVSKEDMARIIMMRDELECYLLGIMADRQRMPADDLISKIVHSQVDGEQLSTHEALEMIVQFLIAGNETTTKLIGASMLRLAQEPKLAASLRQDPDQIPSFINEILRLEPPVTGLFRTATADCELGGVTIAKGAAVWLVFAAANRDGGEFEDSDTCVIERSTRPPNLAFGFGEHYCLGAGLAKAEARVALEILLDRLQDIALDCDPDAVDYEPSFLMRGLHSLPLVFHRAER